MQINKSTHLKPFSAVARVVSFVWALSDWTGLDYYPIVNQLISLRRQTHLSSYTRIYGIPRADTNAVGRSY